MNEDDNSKLRRLLHSWEVTPPPAPEFNSGVWRKIAIEEEHARAGIFETLRDWFLVQLPRPAYALALLAITGIVGVQAARLRVNQVSEEYRLDHARQYLASIDPIAMTAKASRSSQ